MRSPEEAIDWARAQVEKRSRDWTGYCQMFVRTSFGVGMGFSSAIAQWHGADKKHPTSDPLKVPRGVPVFWEGGNYGHVALSLGNGRCVSTDARRLGWPDVVTIDSITKAWGYKLVGWAEDMNHTTVWVDKSEPKPTPNITAVLNADTVEERRQALARVAKFGEKSAAEVAENYLAAIDRQLENRARRKHLHAKLADMEVR